MRKILVTPATFKPLEVEAVKVRPELRIASATDNIVVADMIQSAIEAYEEYTNGVLCRSTWDLYLDRFPRGREFETPGPLASITSITYLDSSGASQTLATSVYTVDITIPFVGRIALKSGECWPGTYSEPNAVIIRAAIGYANAAAIPQKIKDGLLAKIQELYYGIDMSAKYLNDWRNHRIIPV